MIAPSKFTREVVLDLAATVREVCSGCNGTGEHPYLSGPDNEKSKCPVCLGFGVGRVIVGTALTCDDIDRMLYGAPYSVPKVSCEYCGIPGQSMS